MTQFGVFFDVEWWGVRGSQTVISYTRTGWFH